MQHPNDKARGKAAQTYSCHTRHLTQAKTIINTLCQSICGKFKAKHPYKQTQALISVVQFVYTQNAVFLCRFTKYVAFIQTTIYVYYLYIFRIITILQARHIFANSINAAPHHQVQRIYLSYTQTKHIKHYFECGLSDGCITTWLSFWLIWSRKMRCI